MIVVNNKYLQVVINQLVAKTQFLWMILEKIFGKKKKKNNYIAIWI
jgi:hypothetical protein